MAKNKILPMKKSGIKLKFMRRGHEIFLQVRATNEILQISKGGGGGALMLKIFSRNGSMK